MLKDPMSQLTPDMLLRAYAVGIFPMAESRDEGRLFWIDPDRRGVLPLDRFRVPRRLRRRLRQKPFTVTADEAFDAVMRGCAEPTPERPSTWINREIIELYSALHRMGHAHSIECWRGDELLGGLYGVPLGAAFFGESLVSPAPDASTAVSSSAFSTGATSTMFVDSLTCLNYGYPYRIRPCAECPLIGFVPSEKRSAAVPCHQIPLDASGRTVELFEEEQDQRGMQEVVKTWLRQAIQRLESGPGQRGERGASVCRVGFPANEALFLEANDHPSDPARREHPLRAEVAHAQSQPGGGDERDQDAVVGE